jgi:hypothetical protein
MCKKIEEQKTNSLCHDIEFFSHGRPDNYQSKTHGKKVFCWRFQRGINEKSQEACRDMSVNASEKKSMKYLSQLLVISIPGQKKNTVQLLRV